VSPVPTVPPASRLADALDVEPHLPCGQCGHDLFGVAVTAECPRCRAPVSRTLAATAWLRSSSMRNNLRRATPLLVVSAIGSGLAVLASALLVLDELAYDVRVGATAVQTLAVAATFWAASAASGRLGRAAGESLPGFDDARGRRRIGRMRLADGLAAAGLALLPLAAWTIVLLPPAAEVAALGAAALGFGLMAATSWRHVPRYAILSGLARTAGRARPARWLGRLGAFKAAFETLWLACCGATLALSVAGSEWARPFALVAAIGLGGYLLVWLAMLVATAAVHRFARSLPTV